MGFSSTDLTTEDGALSATGLASWACFIMALFSGLSVLTPFGVARFLEPAEFIAGLGIIAAEIVLFLVAGFRFRAGRGYIWGIAAAVVLVLEIIFKLVTMIGWLGLTINAVFLVVIINGIRGAAALKRGFPEYDEQADIFG